MPTERVCRQSPSFFTVGTSFAGPMAPVKLPVKRRVPVNSV